MSPSESPWLGWARRLDAMARIGATFAENPYETRRYAELATIARDMLAHLAGCAPESVPDLYLPEEGYVTPKVDVRAAAFDDGRILLVREVSDGRWSLPGGWADVGEAPAASAQREAREESGYEVRLNRLVGIFDAHAPASAFSAYKVVFAGTVSGGSPGGDHETDAVDFFDESGLPPLSQRRTPPRVVAAAFAAWRDPKRAAVFD